MTTIFLTTPSIGVSSSSSSFSVYSDITISRVRLDRNGYDGSGSYWGEPETALYECSYLHNSEYQTLHFRADSIGSLPKPILAILVAEYPLYFSGGVGIAKGGN